MPVEYLTNYFMAEPVTFEKLQEYANKIEDDYMSKLEEQKKMQDELQALNSKFEAHRTETAFSAAEWRGIAELAKMHFGKELESKASKEEKQEKELETEKKDEKAEKKADL